MQWRHDNVHGEKFPPSEGKPVTANGICRVQVTNGTVDRLATVGCSSEMGDPLTALHVLRFGHWLVAMNSNLYLAEQWAVPASYVGRTFSGQQICHPDPSLHLILDLTYIIVGWSREGAGDGLRQGCDTATGDIHRCGEPNDGALRRL